MLLLNCVGLININRESVINSVLSIKLSTLTSKHFLSLWIVSDRDIFACYLKRVDNLHQFTVFPWYYEKNVTKIVNECFRKRSLQRIQKAM